MNAYHCRRMKKQILLNNIKTATALCIVGLTTGHAVAQNSGPGSPVKEVVEANETVIVEDDGFSLNKAFDTLWSLPVLYKDKKNPWIQEVALTGRYQGQIWHVNSNKGDACPGWQNRRQRIGGKVKFLKSFEAYIDLNLNFEAPYTSTNRFVQDYEGFGLKWKPLDEFNVEVGLTKVPITNEWRTSSKEIITIERSDFINTAIPNKLGGVIANGKISDGFTKDGKFTYGAGVYTATRDDDWAYPTFDGGSVIYSGIGYEFNKNHKLRYDNSFLVGNTDAPTNATKPYAYTSALSYSGKFLDKKLSFDSDLVMAIGEDSQADLFGVILLPSYKLTEQIELVARYQYLVSNDDNGVSLQSRYERRASDLPTSKGNNYHALYGGVNYYIYKDKLKLMGGLEYSHMDLANKGSFNQMTLFGAVRFYF